MASARTRAGGVLIAGMVAGLVYVGWPSPERVAVAPMPAEARSVPPPAPLPPASPRPAPATSGPEHPIRVHIRSAADLNVSGVMRLPARPTARHGPAWVQDLDARIGGPPTLDMLEAMDAAGIDLTGPSGVLGGWSEWSDLVLLRNALYATVHQGDPDAYDEVLDGIDAARRRWPHALELEELAVQARFIDRRSWGRQLEVARALLDEGRDGAELSFATANEAVFYLLRTQPDAPRVLEDHRRLRWVAETFPARREGVFLAGLQLAMAHAQPEEAARWLAAIEALPDHRLLDAKDRLAFRLGVVAMGGLPAETWRERVAAAVGECWDAGPPTAERTFVGAVGHWQGEAWRWTGRTGQVHDDVLAACLATSELDGPETAFDGAYIVFLVAPP